jgi:hypothetical protein
VAYGFVFPRLSQRLIIDAEDGIGDGWIGKVEETMDLEQNREERKIA